MTFSPNIKKSESYADREERFDQAFDSQYSTMAPVSYGFEKASVDFRLIIRKEISDQLSSQAEDQGALKSFQAVLDLLRGSTHLREAQIQELLELKSQIATVEISQKISQFVELQRQASDLDSRIILRNDKSKNKTLLRQFVNGDRIVAMASGGAFLGSLTGQVPLAVLGAIIGAFFGLLVKSKSN
jgi:hypothetical protein